MISFQVEEKERENEDLRNEVRLCKRKNEAHTAEVGTLVEYPFVSKVFFLEVRGFPPQR